MNPKVEFQIVQEIEFEKSQSLSLPFNVSYEDLTLTPTAPGSTWGSVHKKGEEAVSSMLVPVSNASKHLDLIFSTFRPC